MAISASSAIATKFLKVVSGQCTSAARWNHPGSASGTIVGAFNPGTTARMAGNLGFATYVVSDATATFDNTGPDGKRYGSELLHDVALADLHGEFATVVDTATILRQAHQEVA